MRIAKGVEIDTHDIVLIGVIALGEVCADFAGIVAAHEDDVKVLFVVRKIRSGGLRDGSAVARQVLPEVRDSQFRFAGAALEEIFEFRGALNAWNIGKGSPRAGWRGGRRPLRGGYYGARKNYSNTKSPADKP